nr:E3 ubiquitin protein ligase UBR4 [Hymenolepis microstoma]
MKKTLSIIVKKRFSRIPPDTVEFKAFIESIEVAKSLSDIKIPSDIENCLAFLCSRFAVKNLDFSDQSAYQDSITWLTRATLSQISLSTPDSSNDAFYGLRVLLSEESIPEELDESEFQTLVANSGETDLLSSLTNPPFDSMKKKVKKAQIAKELLEDISFELSKIQGDFASRIPTSYTTVVRNVFWSENGHEILLTCLHNLLKHLEKCDQVNLSSVAIKGNLICQILLGAISSNFDNPKFNLTSLPTLFVNNWIKSIFKVMASITQNLSKYLFTRNPDLTDVPAVSNDVFTNLDLLQQSFFSLFATTNNRQVESFERDAAYLWFKLCQITSYCNPISNAQKTTSPLILLAPRVDSFIKFTSSTLESLRNELAGNSGSPNIASVLFNRLPWLKEEKAVGSDEVSSSLTPDDWNERLTAVDAYERFILEDDFRQSLILTGPLDVYLLDLASAFFSASKKIECESTEVSKSLLKCTENAILALRSLIQLRESNKSFTGATYNEDSFIERFTHFLSLHPESLGSSLTALFFTLAPTSISPLVLKLLHLLPPDLKFPLEPANFRLLATYLLDASCSSPGLVESYCHAAVRASFDDLPPHMAQLISLLTSAFASHSAKKDLFSAIIDTLTSLPTIDMLRALRLTVLLRYQLHYIFDPPRHLNAQVRPAILGVETKVWEFPNLANKGSTSGFFYDLLSAKGKTGPTPQRDGLAIATLVARSDYDVVFMRLLEIFDSWWEKSPSLLHSAYGAQLSWRLLEILPPSAGYVDQLFALVNGDEFESLRGEINVRHRFIYLLVLLDRLRRLPTGQFLSPLTGGENKVSKRNKHRIESIANETFKAQASRRYKSIASTTFSNANSYESFFLRLLGHTCNLPLVLSEALHQLHYLQSRFKSTASPLMESELIFWRGFLHVLRTLVSRISSDGSLKTPGEVLPTNTTTGTTSSSSKDGKEEKKTVSNQIEPNLCSTGTQSINSFGADSDVIADSATFNLGKKKKARVTNSRLFFFISSFMQIALDMMQSCLRQLQIEVGFSTSDNSQGKLVECLCPERLVAIAEESEKYNSLLLASPTTGRLVESLRCASSKSSGDGARLHAFKRLVGSAGSLFWPVSKSDTLSLVFRNHLTNTPVESVSAPRSLLLGCLLKETVDFADCVVGYIRTTTSNNCSPLIGSPLEERQSVLAFLISLHLNPLASTLNIDLTTMMSFYATLLRKTRHDSLLTRFMEKSILNTLVQTEGINDDGLRLEVFSYLEVATGLPDVLTRFVKEDKDVEPLLLFDSPNCTPEYLRLMCVILLRAINPQSHPELYLEAARKILSKAVECDVIVKVCISVLTSSTHRYARLFERLLRLISTPWPNADDVKSRCLTSLLDVAEKYDCPIKGYYIISGFRCLLLASWNTNASTHVRFVAILAKWVNRACEMLSKNNCGSSIKDNLLQTLCAAYDYFNLILQVLSPNEPVSSEPKLDSPDNHYQQNRNLNSIYQLKHPEVRKFFNFFTSEDIENRPGHCWNASLDGCLLQALCGPVSRSTENGGLLTTLPFHSIVTSPLEWACEKVCTFPTTQHQYIRQPWYGCSTCGIVANHGACHLCAQVCHPGHNLSYENTSEFFCDCAAEMGDSGKCLAVKRRAVTDRKSVFGSLMPWLNWTSFQRSIGDSTCELIAKAATRRSPHSTIIYPSENAVGLSSPLPPGQNFPVRTSITISSTSIDTPALPPRLGSSANDNTVAAQETNATSESLSPRLRRTGGIRVRRESESAFKLTPSLEVTFPEILNGNSGSLWKRFRLWRSDAEDERKRVLDTFRQKFGGAKLQPRLQDVVTRLRNQFNKLSDEERRGVLTVVRSPDLFKTACFLLKWELTNRSSSLALKDGNDSFAEVFKEVSAAESLHSLAIEYIASEARTTSHTIVFSSTIVTPVLCFEAGPSLKCEESPTLGINEIVIPPPSLKSNLTPVPSPGPVQADSAVALSGNASSQPAEVATTLPAWVTDILSCPRDVQQLRQVVATQGAIARLSNSLNSAINLAAFLTRIPSVSGEFKHFLVATIPQNNRQGHTSYITKSSVSVFQIDDLLSTAAKCLGNQESGLLTSSSSSSASLSPYFVVDINSLPRMCKINCNCEVSRLTPHPTNGSLCIASNLQNCVIFGLSPLGEACGRLSITPSFSGSKDEILIKPIWLPNSTRYLALLTSKSVQIFDVFSESPKLLYNFKPVEGSFLDATFIYAPRNDDADEDKTAEEYVFSDIVLIVMATFGSMLRQRLLPSTKVSQGEFYLAECLEWEGAGLRILNGMDASAVGYIESLRNPSTGVMANGGASVFYSSSLHLLFHSYLSGHTFVTALNVSPSEDSSGVGIKVNHSFLLTVPKSQLSNAPEAVKVLLKGISWNGPLRNFSDVSGQLGMVSAVTSDSPSQNILIAIDPDTVWIQALPTETQPMLTRFTQMEVSRTPNLTTTAADTNSVKNEVTISNSSTVCASVTSRWSGNAEFESRLFTLQLAKSGAIQVFAGLSESYTTDSSVEASKSSFAEKHNLSVALPGQFWLQSALHHPISSFKSRKLLKHSPIVSKFEDVLLWDSCCRKKSKPTPIGSESIREFAFYALKALPALRLLVERNTVILTSGGIVCNKAPFCDFHEWASPSENVNFYSRDLLHIHTHRSLNQRLKQAGIPLVYSGAASQFLVSSNSSNVVAFTIDIEVPGGEVIVGLRIEMAESDYPQFLSIFDRRYNVPFEDKSPKNPASDDSGQTPTTQSPVFVDLPLTLSEILQLNTHSKVIEKDLQPIRLSVGQSKHPDALTAIDRIIVYTIPRSSVDPALLANHGDLENDNESDGIDKWTYYIKAKDIRIAKHNYSLVKWLDRLMNTGFVTCAVTKPFESIGKAFKNEFTSPIYDNFVDDGLDGEFVASLTDFFRSIAAFEQNSIQPEIRELKPILSSVIRKALPSAFSYPENDVTSFFTNLVHLHTTVEDNATDITSPRAILASHVSNFVKVLSDISNQECLTVAYGKCLNYLSKVWQLTHEYNQGDSLSLPTDLTLLFFSTLSKKLLTLHPPQKSLSSEVNVSWVKLLTPLVKISIFALAESLDRDQKVTDAVGQFIVNLLAKSHTQIACNTRDILSASLTVLFSSSRLMAKILYESKGNNSEDREEEEETHAEVIDCKKASCSIKLVKSTSGSGGNSRLKRIRRPRFMSRRGNRQPASVNDEIDEIGRNLSEMLQFIANTTNIHAEDENDMEEEGSEYREEVSERMDDDVSYGGGEIRRPMSRRNRRTRWNGSLYSDLESVQAVVDEISRSIRCVGARVPIPSGVLRDYHFLEKVDDEEMENKSQHNTDDPNSAADLTAVATANQDMLSRQPSDREEPGLRGASATSPSHTLNNRDGDIHIDRNVSGDYNIEDTEASEQTSKDENDDDDQSESSSSNSGSNSSEGEVVGASNRLQATVDSANASPDIADLGDDGDDDDDDEDDDDENNEMTPDIIQHLLGLVSSQTLDVDTLAGANNSAGETGSEPNNPVSEASLFESTFLENMDEEAILHLALQRSLHDQGGPGTAALLEEQASTPSVEQNVTPQQSNTVESESVNATINLTSNSMDTPASSNSFKSTVSTQVLPPNTSGNEVERKASIESKASDFSEGFLSILFEGEEDLVDDDLFGSDVHLPPSPAEIECSNWSFESSLSENDDDKGEKCDSKKKRLSSSKCSDDENDPPSEPPEPSEGILQSSSRSSQNLCATRACIALMRQFISILPNLLPKGDENDVFNGQLLIPLLQATFTISRLLEATAQCLFVSRASDEMKKLAVIAKITLIDVVTKLSSWFHRLYESEDLSSLKPSPNLECLLLLANLLSRMLISQPVSVSSGEQKHSQPQANVTPTSLMIGKQVFGANDNDERLFSTCIDTCLNIVKSLHSRLRTDQNLQLDENTSSSAVHSDSNKGTVPLNLPFLSTGLYQCSMGINFSSLTYGFGAGLNNASPLIDSQTCMDNLDRALHSDFEIQVTESAVQLAIALLSARGFEDSRTERKTTWCNFAYDLIELLTSTVGQSDDSKLTTSSVLESEAVKVLKCSSAGASRLAGLMRSLLILLVGPKHYLQLKDVHLLKQMLDRMQSIYVSYTLGEVTVGNDKSFFPNPLPYFRECLMLRCINTCLDVALENRSTWERLSLRKPECFVFMLDTSLRVRDVLAQGLLSLVVLAVLQGSTRVCVATKVNDLSEPSSATRKFFNILARLIIAEDENHNLLLNFIRGNVCCRSDKRIRFTAASILVHLACQCRNGSFATAILKHLPQLWSELPAFALYGSELTFLTLNVLQLQPKGPTAESLVNQLMQLLLNQLNAIAEHPRRDIYKSLIRAYSASGIAFGATNISDDALWPGLHLPSTFVFNFEPPSYVPPLVSSHLISCPSDTEPCLLCNHPLESCMPFVNLYWNSHTPSRRHGANGSFSSTPGTPGNAVTLTSSSNPKYPFSLYVFECQLPNLPNNTPTSTATNTTTANSTSVINIEPVTSVSPNVHIYSLRDSWLVGRIVVQFSPPTSSTHNIRTLNILTSDAFECPPARLMHSRHLWKHLVQVDFPPTKHNVVVNLTAESIPDLDTSNSVAMDSTNTVEVNISGGLPLHANAIIFHYSAFQYLDGSGTKADGTETRKRRKFCSRCNVPLNNGLTCSNCRQNGNQCSRCLFINLTDEEVFLCPKCGSSNHNFMNYYVAVRPSYSHVSRLSDEEDRRIALSKIAALTKELNVHNITIGGIQSALFSTPSREPLESIHWPRDNVIKTLTDMDGRIKMSALLVSRLWSLRQSVALYDGRCSLNPSSEANVPCFNYSGGDDRCLRCVQAAITLLAHLVSSFKPSVFSEDLRKEFITRGIPLLNSLCAAAQGKLLNALCRITSNSVPIINHFGDLLISRLTALAQCDDDIFDFHYSTYLEVSLLKINLKAVMHDTTICVDRNQLCLEARLRIFFRLIKNLFSYNISPVVMDGVIMDCVKCLTSIIDKPKTQPLTYRAPGVNFEAWLRGDESAGFDTWLKQMKIAQQMSIFAPKLTEGKPSRELILSARFARRWRSKTLYASLPPLAKIERPVGLIVTGGWLKPLLDYSFQSNREMCFQSVGLDLLTKLVFSELPSSSYRTVDCMHFLLQHYVPKISSLVRANRGSVITGDLPMNPMIAFLWTLTADDLPGNTMEMISKRTLRHGTESVSKSLNSSGVESAASIEPLVLTPLLLSQGRLFVCVDRNQLCLEARLRIFFRLIKNLFSYNISPVVMDGVIMDCVKCLTSIIDKPKTQPLTYRAPGVNFEAWLRGDESAGFDTWLKQMKIAQQMSIFAPKLTEGKPSRELILSARFARRWRSKTLYASLPPLAKIERPVGLIVTGGWLKPLLDYSFQSNREMCFQSVGLDLLTKLVFSELPSSSYRTVDCMHFLLQHYVPKISSLVRANRGSVITGDLPMNPMIAFLWTLTADDLPGNTMEMISKRTLRHGTESVSKSLNSSGVESAASIEPLVLTPLLLSQGRLFDRVEALLTETLNSLSSFEGVNGEICELPHLYSWTNALPSRLAAASGSGAAPSINAGYIMMHISDLLAILQPLNKLRPEYQDRLFSLLLRFIVVLQALVFQRTSFTIKAEALFKELLQQIMLNVGDRVADFIRITMDYLSQCSNDQSDNYSSVVFLLKRICDCACPLPGEIPPFEVRVSVWRDQEEYLVVRRTRNVIMSNTRGFGPTIGDVVTYICTENNLTTSILLEVVCEGNILMPNLLLEDVYKYIWLQNNHDANVPMELTYRIAGLENDNLPYLSHIPHPTIPFEQYSRLAVLTEHPGGFKVILSQLSGLTDALKCRDLLHTSVHLLEYSLKVPECQASLLDPQLRVIPILLDALYACLKILQQQNGQIDSSSAETESYAHFHNQVTSRLVGILTTILNNATNNSEIENQVKGNDSDLMGLPRLLSCISLHPDMDVVQSGVAKLPGLLAFGSEARMTAIVDFLRINAVQPLLIEGDLSIVGRGKDLLQCCCALVMSIPHNTVYGRCLRAKVVEDLRLLELSVDFLWKVVPSNFLSEPEEAVLDTNNEAISKFSNNSSLPFVLQLLRGCMWCPMSTTAGTKDPPSPIFPSAPPDHTTRQLLAFLHKLEDSRCVGQIDLLCEDLFNEWIDAARDTKVESKDLTTFDGVICTIRELRYLSEQRHRQNARACREKHLLALNMKVNEKGQVAMTTANLLTEMAAQVVEETGLQCAICHEGPRSAPREELGIYAFIRRTKLEESLIAEESVEASNHSKSSTSTDGPQKVEDGYTTVSSFVLVHFDCHARAVRASTQNEWTVATRHNRDARCNCLLPVLMREAPAPNKDEGKIDGGDSTGKRGDAASNSSMSDLFAKRVNNHNLNVSMVVSMTVNTRLSFHDIKLLLLRFAYQRSFHGETGGGARESNLNLVPHLMQLAFYQMKKEQTLETERSNLIRVLETPESYWYTEKWEAAGPLYCAVVALHLFSRSEWDKHRVALLRRLIVLAHARAMPSDAKSSEALAFSAYKPYLLYFGLIQAFYTHFFKNVKGPNGEESSNSLWWPEVLSEYIRVSDEILLSATPELLSFFEDDLLPVDSVDEFLDVTGMLSDVDANELIHLGTTGSR